jgi:predicted ATPase
VSAAAPLLAQLLEQCAGLRLLVTSREPLRLRAEQRFQAPPLEPAAAVELFLQRAQAINADFVISAKIAASVAEICLRLDCLPLAIELVAVRSEMFTPSELLNQLQRGRLALLEGGARDLPERHRTLRNAIAWSYQLLSLESQRLFRALGIFLGGFDLAAARLVIEDASSHEPATSQTHFMTNLQALVASNLLVQHEVDGSHRYTMFETIREFAIEQATLHQEVEDLRRCHAHYFLDWTEAQVQWSFDHAEGVWWRPLEQEHENLRAALHWSLQSDGEQALRLAIALHPFWDTRGYQTEGSRWLQQALARNPTPSQLRAQGLLKAGIFAQQQMDFQPATQMLNEALTLFRVGPVGCGRNLARLWLVGLQYGRLGGRPAIF